jgi:hypothetical protein
MKEYGFKIKLKKRSWFGDYQVLMQVDSTWTMTAHVDDKEDKKHNTEDHHVKIMSIDANMFRKYVDEYPDFRRFLILRSTVRRAYFNYRMKMESYRAYLLDKERVITEKIKEAKGFPDEDDNGNIDIYGRASASRSSLLNRVKTQGGLAR